MNFPWREWHQFYRDAESQDLERDQKRMDVMPPQTSARAMEAHDASGNEPSVGILKRAFGFRNGLTRRPGTMNERIKRR